jgi:hypothetical protein
MHAAPRVRKAVPSKAVRIRKMKYEARFGESAVPREQQQKRKAVIRQICCCISTGNYPVQDNVQFFVRILESVVPRNKETVP